MQGSSHSKFMSHSGDSSQSGPHFQAADLTCLVSEGGGLALAVLRYGDHTNLIVDARLQSVNGVVTRTRRDRVLKNGEALSGGHHHDLVPGDGRGVERRPAETDAGVAHVLKAEVGQLRYLWICGRNGENRKRRSRRWRKRKEAQTGRQKRRRKH